MGASISILGTSRAANVAAEVQSSIDRVAKEFGRGRTGGYLCIRNPESDLTIMVPAGTIDPLKLHKYRAFAEEKAARLATYPHHHLSWQSRDVGRDMWGGAVRTPWMLLSFSGMPEMIDEALMLTVAVRTGLLTVPEAQAMARISSNEHFEAVFACR